MAFKVEVSGLNSVLQQLELYMKDLNDKLDTFIKRLAEEGVEIAKSNISTFGSIDTGQLLDSIDLKKGDVLTNGVQYLIYTDIPYAKFVEFGTGIVGAGEDSSKPGTPHPLSNELWAYDVHGHGENGWYYYKNEKIHWTKGQISKPFMYDTAQELYFKVSDVAREVFG